VSAIEKFEALAKEHLFARRLRVGAAFHSHHMQPMHTPYIEGIKALGVGTEKRVMKNLRYDSPTTGTCMSDAAELASAEHWARSMIRPVLLVDAFREMALDSQTGERLVDCVIKVSPHAALAGLIPP
jgi:acyl transferase domain-containing protein